MFHIDRFGRQPIYEQIIEQVLQLVASGVLKPGDQLPSVRSLSQALSANPNTLQKAYTELERRGITMSVPGSGRFIGKDAQQLVATGMEELLLEVTAITTKLAAANVAEQKVLEAVRMAYAKTASAVSTTSAAQEAQAEAKS